MTQLTLLKNLARIQEEQKHSQIHIEVGPFKLLRGSLTELSGEASSGKTSLTFMLLASLTQNGEICSVVDINNSFNPLSAKQSGIVLENILWIRCDKNLEHAFRVIDYLIQANNFGLIWIDFCDRTYKELNHIPSSYWYRFRTRIKDSQTLLIVTSKSPLMGSASNYSFQSDKRGIAWMGQGKFKLVTELRISLNTRKPFFVKPENLSIAARY